VIGPLLRDSAEGADTMVWLVAADPARIGTGGFWHDRRRRSLHKVPKTRRSDTAGRRARLWDWCVAQTGVEPLAGAGSSA
jgi:dehydrogenase/reductase SDR family protein 12